MSDVASYREIGAVWALLVTGSLGVWSCTSDPDNDDPGPDFVAAGGAMPAPTTTATMEPPPVPTSTVQDAGHPPVPDAHVQEPTNGDGALDAAMPDVAARPDSDADGGGGLLSETGLYVDPVSDQLADGVRFYTVRFPLWSDGATKRRWFWLPPGTSIDTSEADDWQFPIGTKVWKEFTREGKRIETRLLEKVGTGSEAWTYIAYIWNETQTDAVAAPEGLENASGTPHDVPKQSTCFGCHVGSRDFVLGFSALQVSHDVSGLGPAEREAIGVTLADLVAESLLTNPPSTSTYVLPGDDLTQKALGMLHSNCGNCHRPGTLAYERTDLDLHLPISSLGAVADTPTFVTSVGIATTRLVTEDGDGGANLRIQPGAPGASAVYRRMVTRTDGLAMPPIGSELVDTAGAQTIFDWISTL